MVRLRDGLIGSISAWLPSRRSVDSQRGAVVIVLPGQVRSGRSYRAERGVAAAGHATGDLLYSHWRNCSLVSGG